MKAKPQLDIVAKLLQVDPLVLQSALCFRSVTIRNSVSMIPLSVDQAAEARDALAKVFSFAFCLFYDFGSGSFADWFSCRHCMGSYLIG